MPVLPAARFGRRAADATAGEAEQRFPLGVKPKMHGPDEVAFADRERIGLRAIRGEHEERPPPDTQRARGVEAEQPYHQPHAAMREQLHDDITIFADAGGAAVRRDDQRRQIAQRPHAPGGRAFPRGILAHARPGRPKTDRHGGDDQHVRPERFVKGEPQRDGGERDGDAHPLHRARRTPARAAPHRQRHDRAGERRQAEHPDLRGARIDRGVGRGLDPRGGGPDQPRGAVRLHQMAAQAGEIDRVPAQAEHERDGQPQSDRHARPIVMRTGAPFLTPRTW